MKTFEDLIKEVQTPGLCHHCGGCVTFCTSINYGALALDDTGMPHYADKEKCIECGLCYSICPEIDEMQEETRKVAGWVPPMGNILETTSARALDPMIRNKGTDGGVVTALLVHLLDKGHIDGAIVTKQTGPFIRDPMLATTRQEIIDSAGFYFDSSHGVKHFGHDYSTYSPSVQEFRPMMQKGLRRVALVGTPCQIQTLRKIEAMGIVPSDSIKYSLGLFCSGNFIFDEPERKKLESLGGFKWEDVIKVNIKEELIIRLNNGTVKNIGLDKIEFMKRYACKYCPDYSSEYADVSFGGIGSDEGWTTIITRSPTGRAIIADAKGQSLEIYDFQKQPDLPAKILDKVKKVSAKKKAYSQKMHDALVGQ
ncbi:Coenzyme F420 hydrogenase, subunit beta [Desulfonema limicola]|uniref:Coenzyme F420 hydrogenase, subunit beta n=1 Tax=Desulfonema limicola TaxID=45656 RepID=A0A975B954_9BACT|nr:Coenzyme F420 hydrogenase/dehydrogenase, beta subunit C-terminal domain [Desulfonema limicola]QTA80870.1 Coenzyme F420 hydrogenase, subunit beta [Desulfonema limicola]